MGKICIGLPVTLCGVCPVVKEEMRKRCPVKPPGSLFLLLSPFPTGACRSQRADLAEADDVEALLLQRAAWRAGQPTINPS